MTYFVEQKLTALVNQYYVFGADGSGEKAGLVAFAQQKRFSFKEQIDFYADDTKSQVIFSVKAERMMDVHGKFVVTDEGGQTLGVIRKSFRSSLLRSTWEIVHDDQPYLTIQERSLPLAIARRVWGFVPYLGEIPFFVRYHFDIFEDDPSNIVGSYEKLTSFRDHYKLDIPSDDIVRAAGWQTYIALVVMLDALQGR